MKAVWLGLCMFIWVSSVMVWPFRAGAQTPARQALTGTWIGVHTEWDSDFVCPLPTYLRFDDDGTYHLGMVDGSETPIRSTWAIEGDTVRLDTIHYAPGLVQVTGDLLHIGTQYPMLFRRFHDRPADSVLVARQLAGHSWQSDSLLVSFYANGRVTLENSLTKQRTAHFWKLARFRTSVFVIILGNPYNRNGDYALHWQVVSASPDQMEVLGWNSGAVATQTFRQTGTLSAGDSCRPSGFQTCANCFRRIWNDAGLGRSAKRYDLAQVFMAKYQPLIQSGQSGLVRVQFIVNCQGEHSPLEVAGFGDDYCPKTFDSRITNQLLTLCRDHIATDPTIREANRPGDSPQDVAVSLTFRLKDGRLTDILP